MLCLPALRFLAFNRQQIKRRCRIPRNGNGPSSDAAGGMGFTVQFCLVQPRQKQLNFYLSGIPLISMHFTAVT